MQHDEMIWSIVNNQFCSFKTTIGTAKSEKRQFCKHPYSVTGLCNRTSCPLANSRYATVREEGGRVSLFVKTVERAHSPKNLWEKISLSRNYGRALKQLDEHLAFFPKAQIHRNKQRLTKIHQYLLRMRKIRLKELAGKRQSMVGINRKVEQREGRREKKALVAAKVEKNIEKELVERLARGTYGDIYNFPEAPYRKALEEAEEREEEDEEEMEEEEESESEEEEVEGEIEYVEDLEEDDEMEGDSSEEDEEDMEYMGDGKWGRAGSSSDESESESGSEEEEEDSGSEEESGSEHDSNDENESGPDSGSDEDSEGDSRRPRAKPDKKKKKPAKKKKSRRTRVEIEYEEEREDEEARMETESGGGEAVAGMAW